MCLTVLLALYHRKQFSWFFEDVDPALVAGVLGSGIDFGWFDWVRDWGQAYGKTSANRGIWMLVLGQGLDPRFSCVKFIQLRGSQCVCEARELCVQATEVPALQSVNKKSNKEACDSPCQVKLVECFMLVVF